MLRYVTFVFIFVIVNYECSGFGLLHFGPLSELLSFAFFSLIIYNIVPSVIMRLTFLPSPSYLQLGLDDTRLHRANGIMVLLSFFLCRILVFPFMYWMYGQQFGIPLHRVAFHLPLQCNVGNLVILAPQVYWFIVLLRKAKRLYLRQKRSTADGDKSSPRTD